MTALRFTREATRVEAMRLEDEGDLSEACLWLAERGVAADIYYDGGAEVLVLDGRPEPARVGQWLTRELETGWVDVVDGDEHRPDGCAGGLGVVGNG